eukprot:5107026-Pyramimonas_sp.AAC.1
MYRRCGSILRHHLLRPHLGGLDCKGGTRAKPALDASFGSALGRTASRQMPARTLPCLACSPADPHTERRA